MSTGLIFTAFRVVLAVFPAKDVDAALLRLDGRFCIWAIAFDTFVTDGKFCLICCKLPATLDLPWDVLLIVAIEGEIDLTLLIMGTLLLVVTVNEGDDVIAGNLFGALTLGLGDLLTMDRLMEVKDGREGDETLFCKSLANLLFGLKVGLELLFVVTDARWMFDLATEAAACCLANVLA